MSSNKYWKCYFGCEYDGVLHRFPNPVHDEDRFVLWMNVLDSETQKRHRQYIYNNLRLCDKHFELCYHVPSGKLTRNAVPTLKLAFHQPLHMDESILSQSAADNSENSANVSAFHQPLLMDESILSQCSADNSENSANVSALLETTQPLLQNEELLQVIKAQVPRPIEDLPVDVCVTVTEPIIVTSKDITQSTDTYKASAAGHKQHRIVKKPTSSRNQMTFMPTTIMGNADYKQAQRKIHKLEHKLKKLSEKYKTQRKKIKCARNLSNSKQFVKLIETFPEPMKIFTNMQMKGKFKARGRRYTLEEKAFSLGILKQSAKAYNFLKKRFVLPSQRSLQKLLSRIPLGPGINENIFQHLKKAVKGLPIEKRLCTLIFDEVALESGLYFNKGQITGFEDFGFKNSSQIADHALVFMVKSIKGKFKQPICYTFCRSCTKKEDLKHLIKLIIQKINKTGLKIIATVCDQSKTNVGAIKSLREDTKRDHLRKGLEYHSYSFEIENNKIFPLFDTPHLLKGVRNNLLKKDAIFIQNKIEKTAKWEHLKMLLSEDVGEHELRFVNKLTESHVSEAKLPKMKVKYAVEVFSQRVSSAMRFLARHTILPATCADTADFLLIFDKLFDSFNGSTYSGTSKELRGCLKYNSPHVNFWKEVLPVLKSVKYKTTTKNKDGVEKIKHEKIPSTENWATNIETFMEMWEVLKKEHQVYTLMTRNFNQDPLENFFSSIRSNGVRNINPTCMQFTNAYKTLLVNNLNSPHSVNANCEADDNKSLLKSLTNLLKSEEIDSNVENVMFNVDKFVENLKNSACLTIQDDKIIHKETKRYVAGYIIHKCQKKIFKNCPTCKSNFYNEIDPETYTYYRDYTKKSLVYAKDDFIELSEKIYEIITLCLKDSPHERQLKEKITRLIDIDVNFNILTCKIHKPLIIKGMVNIAINIIVHSWCKCINQLLKGKIVKFDKNDSVKAQAREYYNRRCKK